MSMALSQKYFELQRYVGWTDDDQQRVAAVREGLLAHADYLVDDFYDEIQRHPRTARVIVGGQEQITRLKVTLRQWLRQLLTGPYDRDYVLMRTNVGRRHVAIGLDQVYTNAAMSRLRIGLCQQVYAYWEGSPEDMMRTLASLNRLLDLDLAIIEDAYQTEFLSRQESLSKENFQLRAALEREQTNPEIVGESEAMQEVYRLIERTGSTDKPILIQGESGTGKELVATALHQVSRFSDKPIVVINCAALPENLLESELFGHEKGAFTGAVASKPGLFEVADGGTLFIDEIGELAGGLQAKLLRVLEDGSLRRVGSVKERHVNVRLLAATNRDLNQAVNAGTFREDLFYRINVLTILLPPLRERGADIRLLLEHFAADEWRWDESFLDVLRNYSWPGNVRQLRNAIDRAMVLAEDDTLLPENLPPEILRHSQEEAMRTAREGSNLDTVNRHHISDTFQRFEGNKARTARALGISRRTLYRLLEKYAIEYERGGV
ncbi:MAG: AAA domain-containing protein [Planctomycetes bacterium]|nr:AAA domain-containing protein [Planctomycetota bacterium]